MHSLPRKVFAILAAALSAICMVTPVTAQVAIKDAWVRATVPHQTATGAFMQITSPADAVLVEVQSGAAGIVEMHEMKLVNNVMKMRAVEQVALPAGQLVELKPGGYHVMMMDLKAQVKAGDTIPLMLVFEGKDKKRFTMEVKASVRALGGSAPKGAPQHGEHKH